ncbi:uncharacterized protein B4U80_05411 [Leptotrombidium deliense]|uniref:G-protein coupled receptors family 2 profile 2 domain-containing protein n=1 Tax=Leptotrombidium deliense TaxID=299467 RepID=A0A443SR58_9ACAR|nr:uncharacterized protein B4U80_05411 [Leptotrombidium deliense]
MCSFSIENFDTYADLKEKFNARLCVKAIDTCSQYEDPNCKAYSGYIYQRRRSVADPIVAFKNYACVLCNGAQKKLFTCDTPDPQSQEVLVGVSFSMLFDFNFEKGRLVGQDARVKCRLIDGFVFDSITSQCVQMYCGKLFRFDQRNGLCVRIEGSESGIASPCPKILVNRDNFDLLKNGSIVLHNNDFPLVTDEYEVYSSKDGSVDTILRILSTLVLVISCICLILHLIVFAIVPKLRNEPGKCVASMAVALLFGNISFIIGTEVTPNYKLIALDQRGSMLCVVMSVVIHYSFLSATFWMNVMSFDVSATFKRTIRVARCKFWSYSLYAWITPAVIVSTSCLLDALTDENNFKPMYGYTVCWISQRVPLVSFFVFPVIILLLMNYVFFGITIRGIKRSEKQTKIVKHTNQEDSLRVYMYIKLAILMGLTWITGTIAALLDSEILWICFIVINGSQGSLLFFLFTCKRSIYEKVKQRSFSSRFSDDSKTKSVSLSQSQAMRRSNDSLNSSRVFD